MVRTASWTVLDEVQSRRFSRVLTGQKRRGASEVQYRSLDPVPVGILVQALAWRASRSTLCAVRASAQPSPPNTVIACSAQGQREDFPSSSSACMRRGMCRWSCPKERSARRRRSSVQRRKSEEQASSNGQISLEIFATMQRTRSGTGPEI